jgi:hypothetical protein
MVAGSRADIAQAMLETGFVVPTGRTHQMVSQIANEQTVPPDLKASVCGTGIAVAKADQVSGWGVSLGRYKGAVKADSVLASNVAIASNVLMDTQPRGVLKVPFVKNEYLAMAWGMPERQTQSVCNHLRALNHHCEVVSPDAVTQFQQQALKERATRPAPAAAKAGKRKAKTVNSAKNANTAAKNANTAKGDGNSRSAPKTVN